VSRSDTSWLPAVLFVFPAFISFNETPVVPQSNLLDSVADDALGNGRSLLPAQRGTKIEQFMKLIRFGELGKEKPGLLMNDGTRLDTSASGLDYNEDFFGGNGIDRLRRWAEENSAALPRVEPSVRLGAAICRPSKIVCIGLNYKDHAAEAGLAIPTEPVIFFKSTSSLVGPNDRVVIPKGATKLDWEVELAFVIGKEARYVAKQNALNHVAGYVLHNDYSERAFQLERGGQWVKGKSADTFAPLGPFLATCDEIPDPGHLSLWLKVNGATRQKSNTEQMIFGVAEILSYVSQFMTLIPGDVISTGTPAGVGLGLTPPQYLKAGDSVALGIKGLGESQQMVVAYEE
jgi:2-keto-4-pentenoate hydratase/2-oxohepta-3-ene-1,7-dioic acid hydratase in catechol pathway